MKALLTVVLCFGLITAVAGRSLPTVPHNDGGPYNTAPVIVLVHLEVFLTR